MKLVEKDLLLILGIAIGMGMVIVAVLAFGGIINVRMQNTYMIIGAMMIQFVIGLIFRQNNKKKEAKIFFVIALLLSGIMILSLITER